MMIFYINGYLMQYLGGKAKYTDIVLYEKPTFNC